MDDGSIQNKGFHRNVYGFSFDEVINLKIIIKNTLENLFLFNSSPLNSGLPMACHPHRAKAERLREEGALSPLGKGCEASRWAGGSIIKCSIHNHKKGFRIYNFA